MLLQDYCFLIDHAKERMVFDLGIRKGLQYNKHTKRVFDHWPTTATTSVQDHLTQAGISLDSIRTIAFSHTHLYARLPCCIHAVLNSAREVIILAMYPPFQLQPSFFSDLLQMSAKWTTEAR